MIFFYIRIYNRFHFLDLSVRRKKKKKEGKQKDGEKKEMSSLINKRAKQMEKKKIEPQIYLTKKKRRPVLCFV